MRSSPHPNLFSTFQFSWTNVSVESMEEFVDRHGQYVLSYRFPEPRELGSGGFKGDAYYASYAQCKNILLSGVPNLQSLRVMMYDYRLPPGLEKHHTFPHLRRLWIRLEPKFDNYEVEALVKKLVGDSTSLQKLIIHNGSESIGEMSKPPVFLTRLPTYLNGLPSGCKAGTYLSDVTDATKDAMEALISTKLQFYFCGINKLSFTDVEAFNLFWIWVAKQPITKLWFLFPLAECMTVEIRQTSSILPLSFVHCRKLRLYYSDSELFTNGLFTFPNVSQLQIEQASCESLKRLAVAMPLLQRLICKSIEDA